MTERVIDRKGWPKGPWDDEPDRVEWRSAAGYPALIVRSQTSGSLCGYVGVPPGHPAHRKHYDCVEADVHGGLTYADECQGAICHVPTAGESQDVWWLGFDTAHCGDYAPGIAAVLGQLPGRTLEPYVEHNGTEFWLEKYRTLDYVRKSVEALALQLKKLAEP